MDTILDHFKADLIDAMNNAVWGADYDKITKAADNAIKQAYLLGKEGDK